MKTLKISPLLLLLELTTGGLHAERDPLKVVLTSPSDHAKAPWRLCVSGRVSRREKVVLTVRPQGGDYFVQPAVSVKDDLTFRALIYIAEEKRGAFDGQVFEIQAVANPTSQLAEGQVLMSWPTGEAESSVLDVVRSDDAPSGCEGEALILLSRLQIAHYYPHLTSTAPRNEPTAGTMTVSAGLYSAAEALRTIRIVVFVFVWVVFVVMIARPERARSVMRWVARCVECWFALLRETLRSSFISVCKLLEKEWTACAYVSRAVWSARGYHGDLKSFVLNLLLVPVLWILFLVTFYPSTLTYRMSLSLVMPASAISDSTSTGSGFLFSPNTTHVAAAHVSDSTSSQGVSTTQTSGRTSSWRLAESVLDTLRGTWQRDPILLSAMGLAALDAALGAVLLWGLGADEALRISFIGLFRKHPIPCFFFVGFNLAMTLLAAYRAYEVSPDNVGWIVPAVVAGTLAFAMPWTMAWVLFCALEATTKCMGPTLAASTITTFVTVEAAVAVGWIVITTTLLVLIAAVQVLLGFCGCCLIVYAWVADSIGDLLRWWHAQFTSGPKARGRAALGALTAGAAALFALMTFAVVFQSGCSRVETTDSTHPSSGEITKGASASASKANPKPLHDPNLAYRAWAYVVDTSASPLPEEFQRAKLVLRQSVKRDVRGNDLVWIIPINAGFSSSQPFSFPPVSTFKNDRNTSASELQAVQSQVLGAIDALQQKAESTDLTNPISLALNILHDQPEATERFMIIASDFIQDQGTERRDNVFSALNEPANAVGIHVLLLFTAPKPQYLSHFHASVARAYNSLQDWAKYFADRGAVDVNVRNVDTLVAQVLPFAAPSARPGF